jgi:hypothetical protein
VRSPTSGAAMRSSPTRVPAATGAFTGVS